MKLDYTEIGIRVQNQRRRLKMTQSDMAKKLGITPSQVSHIETGVTRPSLDVVAGICSVLDISADELIFGKKSNSDNMTSADNSDVAIRYADLMNSDSEETDLSDANPFNLEQYLVDCPKMDQEVIVDVVKTVKKGLLAARLNAYSK